MVPLAGDQHLVKEGKRNTYESCNIVLAKVCALHNLYCLAASRLFTGMEGPFITLACTS